MPSLTDVRQALQCGGSNCACRRPSGNVHCPVSTAHKRGDKDPSLSVEVKNGTLVWKCYSGCAQNAVRDALVGLGLWGQSQTPAPIPIRRGQEPVAVYRYVTADGELVGEKGRFETPTGKTFKWRLSGKAWSGLEGTPMSSMPLYNLPQVLSEPDATVWFVEGEKAVEACRKAGLVAVCLGGGAGQQQPGNALDPLVGRDVVLWPDNDEPGFEFMERMARLLPGARIVRPVVPEKGDAHDYFEAGGTAEGLRALLRDGQPVARPLSDDSIEVKYPTPAGVVTFTFSEMNVGQRATDCTLVVRAERIPNPYSTRVNIASSSARDGVRKDLEKVLKPLGVGDWTTVVVTACSLAGETIRRQDGSVDLADVSAPIERAWAVGGFAPHGAVTTVFGMGGSGKSFLAADVMLHSLYGEPWLGRPVENVLGALVIDYEDQADEWRLRAEQICRAHGWTMPSGFRYLPGRAIPLFDQAQTIRALVEKYAIGLIVVDSAASAVGGQLTDTAYTARTLNFLASLGVSHGVTTIVIAHTVKDFEKKATTLFPYGDIFWHNLSRSTHYVETRQEDGSRVAHIDLWNRKGNRGKQKPIPVRIDFPDSDAGAITISLDDGRTPADPMPQSSTAEEHSVRWDIAKHLRGAQTATVRDISEATGIPEDTVRGKLNANAGKGADLFVRVEGTNPQRWALKSDREEAV